MKKIKQRKRLFRKFPRQTLNSWLLKLLHATGINEKQSEIPAWNFKIFRRYLHPYILVSLLIMIYNITVAFIYQNRIQEVESKSRYSVPFSSFCPILIWHLAYNRRHELCALLKEPKRHVGCGKNKDFAHALRDNFILYSACLNFVVPVLYPAYIVLISDIPISVYLKAWCLGYQSDSQYVNRIAVFVCVFAYASEIMWFPSFFIIIFYSTAIDLGRLLERAKNVLEKTNVWQSSLPRHSRLHEELLNRVKSYESTFSFPMFVLLCMTIALGFTGLALEMERVSLHHIQSLEGILFLVYGTKGVVYVASLASEIPVQLQEIREVYIRAYDHAVSGGELSLQSERVNSKLAILKVISDRPIVSLTAWNVVRLNKNLIFTTFGSMMTYGLLIIQLKDQ